VGPRRGKRTLGFAALVLAVVAAAVIILLSQADEPPVQPIREEAASAERHEGRILAEKDPIGKPIPNAPTRSRRIARRVIRIKQRSSAPLAAKPRSATPKSKRLARRQRRAQTKRHRSRKRSGHEGAPVSPAAAPPPPVASPSPPASAAAPAVPAQPTPAPAPAPGERPVEIRIEHGALTSGFNFVVYSRGERVRLHVSSDESVVVQIPGYGISQPIAPGVGALIEFDATRPGLYEVKLQGKKKKLTLALIRVRD
jgi:hypothetical protein